MIYFTITQIEVVGRLEYIYYKYHNFLVHSTRY